MENRVKFIAGGVVLLLGILVLAWVLWPEPAPKVDPALVETAAESARLAAAKQPSQDNEPKYEGKAKPGPLGGK